jgi:hypothetical protein
VPPTAAKKPRAIIYWLLAIGYWLVIAGSLLPAALAQSDTGGTIAGQITGLSGNLIHAIITLRNTATGIEIVTLSDVRGNFRFAEVTPGTYMVRINAPGAAPWRAFNVNVEVGRTTPLAPLLTVAIIDGRHKKHEYHAPGIDLTPAVNSNIDQDFVENLPSSEGRWSALAALAPGTAPDADGTGALSFRGLSPLMNGITLDGTDNTLAFHARERGTGSGMGSGYATPQSAVSQFQVSSSNFSAEYGRAAGGVINSVTRSGGNTLHMEASFYDRDSAWGAMNAYSKVLQAEPLGTTSTSTGMPIKYVNGQPVTYVEVPYKAPDQRWQGGFNAGGPIRRDKLFWFFAAEYHYRDHPGVARFNEPEVFTAQPTAQTLETLAARISTSSSPTYTGCAATSSGLNAQALCAYNIVLNQLTQELGSVPRATHQLNLLPKIDWRVNNRIHLIGQYSHMRRTSPNGVLAGATETYGIGSFGSSQSSDDSAIARLEYFFTPNLLTSARYLYGRDLISQLSAPPTAFDQQFAHNSYGLAPEISIDRSSGFAIGTLTTQDKAQYPLEIRQQFVDSVTWIHHRHAFRFGYDYNHVNDAVSGVNNQNGEYIYSSLADFVADFLAPNRCDTTTTGVGTDPCYSYFRQTVGSSVWQFQTADYAAFAADDWKLTPRLTLSLGLRYEYEDLPDTNKLVANPEIPRTAYLPHDRNNFGPRAGFAWDVLGKGRTILRGGFGVYYARVSNATVFSALTSTGTARAARSYLFRPLDTGAPPFPYVFASTETPYTDPSSPDANSSAPGAVYFDKHFQNPQIDQAELSLQQQLGQRTALTLTAMASFGHELPQYLDTNIDLSTTATLNYTLDFTNNPQHLGPIQTGFSTPFYYQRVNPAYGPITDILSEANSKYEGAAARITRRTERGIDLNVAYTYSHAVDDNQSQATFASLNDIYDPADLRLEHGTSNFDMRQRVSGAIVAHVPWRVNGFFGKIVNGYSFSTLGEWRTGLPYTMNTMGSIPASECSYEEWLEAGGTNVGNACAADNNPGVIINTGTGHPVPGLGPSLNGSGGEDLLPQVGRNTFRYPQAVGLDVRAGKRTSITDRIAVEFFAEAFNVLNHQNVTNIQTIGYAIANDPADTGTAKLSYLSGLKTESVTDADGSSQTQFVASPTAPFGGVTSTNNNALYHARQFQLGCRFFF